jgi:2-succinyl-5-enolpyruvyl-6-hydroxy-3-cyclohexene-1-carboxylate synthase
MVKKVNRNFYWTSIFVEQLVQLGVKYACISPGSRSSALTCSFAEHNKIKCFVNIDERSSGFYALGLAKASDSPVAVVTTSGTATAELYPAIIEAYQQRVPLIICTADRPPELKNTGSNQMINQKNIYRNHIRWYKDVGIPDLSGKKLYRLTSSARKAFDIASRKDKGPVHLNFPFRKPLEPESFTDEIDDSITVSLIKTKTQLLTVESVQLKKRETKILARIVDKILKAKSGLIISGPQEYDQKLISAVSSLSEFTGYPVLADGLSQLRLNSSKEIIISNYDSFLKYDVLRQKINPDIILQLGRTPTSASLENFLAETDSERFLINKYGDSFDPARNAKGIYKFDPVIFCHELLNYLKQVNSKPVNESFKDIFVKADTNCEQIKTKIILNASFPNEARIIPEILKTIPEETTIIVGNSLPVRDLDSFGSKVNKNLKIFFNRGASGIDGITSTALGISQAVKSCVLITGDLSFLHDTNALLAAKKIQRSIVIVVINNNGGGIFDTLPIRDNKKLFGKYFKTAHNLDLKVLVEAFGHNYLLINSWKNLSESVISGLQKKSLTVLEVRTNSIASQKLREKYHGMVEEKLKTEIL